MKAVFRVHPDDNVGTLLEDAVAGQLRLLGPGGQRMVTLIESIPLGHKVALKKIRAGKPVVKFGVSIGIAPREILPGEWVHLHNCRSQVDERSRSLDPRTGAATDTAYE